MIIRWVCEKCSKKWIYPVEKCAFCKGSISKQLGSKLKVVGFTKVMIASPMHPIVPYNVVLLEDEHGNKIPRKTMKEYKIGDSFNVNNAKTGDAVAITRIKYDVYEAIKEALGLLKDLGINTDDKILVKPSIVSAAYPYQAVNTNPEFLDALIKVLMEYGIKKENILVAEQALIGSDATDAASKAGVLEVCKKNGINFADISKGPFETVEHGNMKFSVFKEAVERKIINAPIMKTNFQIGISGAMENLSRLCDEKTQKEMYQNDIEKTLPKLVNALKNVITVADASNGMQGQGPLSLGEPAFLNLVFAGMNSASIDAAFCEACMLPVPQYVSDNIDSKKIEIVGNEIEALKYPIKQPSLNETPHSDIKVIDGKSCPACLNLMYSLTSKLIGVRGNELHIAMGSCLDPNILKEKQRVVVLGDCAIKKFESMGLGFASIGENIDSIEQLILLKKLLTTEGAPKITNIDKVKTKMQKLLSRVIK